ncbi:hypothetical protein CLU79DRAFT_703802 [Phycomyces nitens]|nr:hypothetical protein CLU79DRAFT_703802 [Phycomyces nitens]
MSTSIPTSSSLAPNSTRSSSLPVSKSILTTKPTTNSNDKPEPQSLISLPIHADTINVHKYPLPPELLEHYGPGRVESFDEYDIPMCYRRRRKVAFTQFWIPKENEWDETNDGERVYLGGEPTTHIKDSRNNILGKVSKEMWDKCNMEGTCLLKNGDLINLGQKVGLFDIIGHTGRKQNVFGFGSGPQNLVPFVSVASNDLPYGQTLYIPEMDGLDLGTGKTHNGCVRVDDTGWSFDECQIDLFVVSYVDYLWLGLPEHTYVHVMDCKVKNYVTLEHLHYVKANTDESTIDLVMKDRSNDDQDT